MDATVTRGDLLKKLGAGAVAACGVVSVTELGSPRPAAAQTPKRGGAFRFPGFDPPNFDPHQNVHWWTFIYLSLTHSGLVRHKAGPGVTPGTLPIEGDLAESWDQPNETTYVFKLKKGVRWHNKPPVNGRELTAEDVVFTFERAMTVTGNPNRTTFQDIDRVEAVDRYTVRFTMKEPFAWFLDTAALAYIVPREAADKDGMFKKRETVIGTGRWMLERYDPNVRLSFARHPDYFRPGLPYADGIEVRIDTDPASKLAAWLSGQYDFAPELHMTFQRTALEAIRPRKPNLPMVEFTWPISTFGIPRLEDEPLRDVRVRRALYMAVDGKQVIETNPFGFGHGSPNPAVPAALRDWSIPIDQTAPRGTPPLRARRARGQAPARPGRPRRRPQAPRRDHRELGTGLFRRRPIHPRPVETDRRRYRPQAQGGQRVHREHPRTQVREAGDRPAGRADHPPYLSRGRAPAGFAPEHRRGERPEAHRDAEAPTAHLRREEAPGRLSTTSSASVPSRRITLYVSPSAKVLSAWEPYVKNFSPNISLDYGGRLMIAWLDR